VSTSPEKRIDHLELILGRILDKALPTGSAERQAVQAELDAIVGNTWNDSSIPDTARRIRNAIP